MENKTFKSILNEYSDYVNGHTGNFVRDLNKYHYDYDIDKEQNVSIKRFLKDWHLNDKFMNNILPEMSEEVANMFTSFKEEYGRWPKLNLNGTDSIQATITVDNKSTKVDSKKYDGERMSREFQKTCEKLFVGTSAEELYNNSYKGKQAAEVFDRAVRRTCRRIKAGCAVAIPIVVIGGYFTWSLLDDIDLAKYYDDSFENMYGDLTNLNDYQTKVHTSYSTSKGNGGTMYHAYTSTEASNYAKAEEAYYRVKRYAKKHNMTMGDAAKAVFNSAEWKALFSMFGWNISEDEDNVYLNMNVLGRTNKSDFANHKFAFGKNENPDEALKVTKSETYDDIPGVSFNWKESKKITKRQLFESLLRV